MTDIEVLDDDPFKMHRAVHARNAQKLRDHPGKWCILAKFDNPNSAAHQAWRLNHKIYGPEGSNPDKAFEFCSKWYDDPDHPNEQGKPAKMYCLLGKYQP